MHTFICMYVYRERQKENPLVWGSLKLAPINIIYILNVTKWHQYDNITVVSRSIYVVCVLYETISTALVSDVKLHYQTMLAISTESVLPLAVNPPTIISLL